MPYLQFHMHTAGQTFTSHTLNRLPRQAIPMSSILHRLDKLTLTVREKKQKTHCKRNIAVIEFKLITEWASSWMFSTDSLQNDLNSRPLGCKEHRSSPTDKPLTPAFNCTWVYLAGVVKLLLAESNSQTHVSTSLVKVALKHQYKYQPCSNPTLFLL